MKELLKAAGSELNINITDEMAEQFIKYKDLLKEWNEKINLTAITDDREIILKHFVDCMAILSKYELDNKSVIDVGTGAGFPGLPIKIAAPSAKLTLLDSLNKRINFLEAVVGELGLSDVSCVHSRAEDGGQDTNYREKFDVCVSRAVANLTVLTEYCMPFVKVGGMFIALKGPKLTEELTEAKKAIEVLGGEVTEVSNIKVPFTDLEHTLVMIKKVRQTLSKYPRKAGKITKSPIK